MIRRWLNNHRRQQLLQQCSDNCMRSYLATLPPSPKADFRDAEYLVADLEMTGLDANKDHILSIGFVPVINGKIILAEANHILVNSHLGVGQSATIHGIHDSELKNALPIADAIKHLLNALRGRVLVLHSGAIDLSFIQPVCKQLFNVPLLAQLVDTLEIEKKRLAGNGQMEQLPQDGLRLFNCRERYNLPSYNAHNALADALATAELFLAQVSYICDQRQLPLKYFLKK
ncbi:exonuclease domain-containing protein [Porticoccus sp. W117]|uniref:exonuclease domain-containing protein n=1 Tax=Porticoccus sp. W117 TaxID=3054777 RepID=UPI00259506B8|nr:exonuclease domain-containing protein [Porticoccus sp. W117]MDM3869928.1 exonuclease domain-containing protein [Porticoccus sp. W117]